jgi:hypothetical protein
MSRWLSLSQEKFAGAGRKCPPEKWAAGLILVRQAAMFQIAQI